MFAYYYMYARKSQKTNTIFQSAVSIYSQKMACRSDLFRMGFPCSHCIEAIGDKPV